MSEILSPSARRVQEALCRCPPDTVRLREVPA
jgi:hypothetical protein